MVLHLEEYTKHDKPKGDTLNYYNKLPEYLHEMSIEDIINHINRNGSRSVYIQQLAIFDYFSWLSNNYGINLVDKNYELKNLIQKNRNIYSDLLDIEQLKRSIEEDLIIAEDGQTTTLPDYSGLKAIFFLEWYGVLPEAAVSIKLTDVSDDGRTVFVPEENRTIDIDDEDVARYFSEYKQKTGFKRRRNSEKETPYPQKTFYRNTNFRNGDINEKTIYNVRQKLINACGDKRLSKKKIYYAGRYYQMFKEEFKLGTEFSASDEKSCEIINRIFNTELSYTQTTALLRDYKVYKQAYLNKE